jgi:sugar phosphate isomerase/epimerase
VAGKQSDPQQARINMNRLKIGIRLESLGLPIRRALREAQRLGAGGVQADAAGDLSPYTLSQTGRSAFRHLLRSHNLELTALGCPMRRGLDSPEDQQQRLDHTKAVLGLSLDLGSRIVIVQAGRVPEEADDPSALLLTEALRVLGRHGNRIGAVLALETGPESGAVLGAFLDCFDTGGLGVNLDPTNLLLHDFDPCESARALRDKVVHARATDARRASASRSAQQVRLGHGDMDWEHYLGVLEEIEYRGWLTVEREGGGDRVAEVAAGVGFLRRFVGPQE